jgi:uncharacterized membrane protein YdbT with pleckstrin-like domain
MNHYVAKFTIVALMLGLFSPTIEVERVAKEGTSVSITLFKEAQAKRKRNKNRNVNRNRNSNRNVNVNRNSNRNVNVNVNHHSSGRHHRSYGYYGGRPIMAFTTGLVIGTVVAASTMPSSCVTVMANNVAYRQCGSTYYMPVYSGSTVSYKVVASPF